MQLWIFIITFKGEHKPLRAFQGIFVCRCGLQQFRSESLTLLNGALCIFKSLKFLLAQIQNLFLHIFGKNTVMRKRSYNLSASLFQLHRVGQKFQRYNKKLLFQYKIMLRMVILSQKLFNGSGRNKVYFSFWQLFAQAFYHLCGMHILRRRNNI